MYSELELAGLSQTYGGYGDDLMTRHIRQMLIDPPGPSEPACCVVGSKKGEPCCAC